MIFLKVLQLFAKHALLIRIWPSGFRDLAILKVYLFLQKLKNALSQKLLEKQVKFLNRQLSKTIEPNGFSNTHFVGNQKNFKKPLVRDFEEICSLFGSLRRSSVWPKYPHFFHLSFFKSFFSQLQICVMNFRQ